MAITFALVSGPTGRSGPNAAGEFAEEIWSITHDGSATTGTLTPTWLRTIDAVIGGGDSSVVINNTSPPGTAAFTFAAALSNGLIQYVSVLGRR